MQSDSPISSPDIDYYEECVVADDEAFTPSGKHSLSDRTLRMGKHSGRVTKKSEAVLDTERASCHSINHMHAHVPLPDILSYIPSSFRSW